MNIVLVTSDLLFGSQISASAQASSNEFCEVASAAALLEAVSGTKTEPLVLLDLTCSVVKKDLAQLIEQIRAASQTAKVLAFGPHVHATLLAAAEEAGCDLVMSRGQFHRQMDEIIAG